MIVKIFGGGVIMGVISIFPEMPWNYNCTGLSQAEIDEMRGEKEGTERNISSIPGIVKQLSDVDATIHGQGQRIEKLGQKFNHEAELNNQRAIWAAEEFARIQKELLAHDDRLKNLEYRTDGIEDYFLALKSVSPEEISAKANASVIADYRIEDASEKRARQIIKSLVKASSSQGRVESKISSREEQKVQREEFLERFGRHTYDGVEFLSDNCYATVYTKPERKDGWGGAGGFFQFIDTNGKLLPGKFFGGRLVQENWRDVIAKEKTPYFSDGLARVKEYDSGRKWCEGY